MSNGLGSVESKNGLVTFSKIKIYLSPKFPRPGIISPNALTCLSTAVVRRRTFGKAYAIEWTPGSDIIKERSVMFSSFTS
jgi:hypothetical protein